MLELTYLRNNREEAVERLQKRQTGDAAEKIDHVIQLDEKRRGIQSEYDNTLSEANSRSKAIGQLMKEGKKEEAEKEKEASSQLKEKSKELGETLQEAEEQLREALFHLPNLPHHDVPAGAGEEQNEVIRQEGKLPELAVNEAHWDLAANHDIIDLETGNKVTGSGFPFYKGKGARLQRALINFFLDKAEEAGYREIQPPLLINEDSGMGTGQLPDKEGMMYQLKDENLFLIPTAEVPITNMYRDTILAAGDLPVKNAGYTPCFRREAGSWGAHVRGLNRVHQFDKVEIVQVCTPEKSYEVLEEMLNYVEQLLKTLEIPYRVLKLCGGDLGFAAAFTYDIEVYSAAQDKWLEVSSISNFETFQANRMKLRYRPESEGNGKEKPVLLHTLNGSALAFPRLLAALLENNQTEDGIHIPEALQKYTGFDKIGGEGSF